MSTSTYGYIVTRARLNVVMIRTTINRIIASTTL